MNFEKVTHYLDSLKNLYNVRCTDCIITKEHEIIYRHLTGTADFEDTIPLTKHNLHDIFSASKVLTMTAVMQLAEQGKLGLQDELSKYLPEFAEMNVVANLNLPEFVASGQWILGWPDETSQQVPAKNKIYIQDMMSMTAGFSYHLASNPVLQLLKQHPHASTREIVREFAKNPLLYEPGTHYSYSYAHDILAAVVEVVSDMKFSDYMTKNIFEPLGARELYYQIPESEKNRLTVLYGYDTEREKHVPQIVNAARMNDCYESGGAGIACTVEDYSKVIDALANGGAGADGARILKPESIAKMSENRLNEQQLKDFHIGGKLEYGYGLGVRTLLDPTASKSPLGEFGWDGAAGAYVLIDPVNHLSLFYVQAAPDSGTAFSDIHPTLRDLVYDSL